NAAYCAEVDGISRISFEFLPAIKDMIIDHVRSRIIGSVQESGKPRVFRGFWTFVKLAHPSSSRCGNVETRVLCGFPSSGAPGMNLSAEYHQSAPGASFPQRGPSFSRNWRLLTFPGHLRPRCAPLRKPRNMHVFTDSRSEPNNLGSRTLSSG